MGPQRSLHTPVAPYLPLPVSIVYSTSGIQYLPASTAYLDGVTNVLCDMCVIPSDGVVLFHQQIIIGLGSVLLYGMPIQCTEERYMWNLIALIS